ncbi:biotin--[acetyl-CoA-carboxylase] ligase [Spirochaeta cellobiosiphila]|uniref:biotin--[acetyl-CoA-carboxylase] ligase n=1 Tax=Spirochaeta cellobiosiphila TaxID=504483 RepID=UPI00040D42CB|nr:biotin--[acetyl-CoA-carboxylase] ligase [Spirochaeta cellobiosiphila]
MVNNKTLILQILQESKEALSGETLAEQLGISRVAAWKHIKSLKEMGYPIRSSKKGYYLEEQKDTLSSYDFPGEEDKVHTFSQISTTMNIARDLAIKGHPHHSVVFAEIQEEGIGRRDKHWESPEGNLYLTQINRIPLAAHKANLILMGASLAMAEGIEQLMDLSIGLKWPNDFHLEGLKLGGILVDHYIRGDQILFSNIGIGINRQYAPSETPGATCLKDHGNLPSRKELYNSFNERWLIYESQLEKGPIPDLWNQRCSHMNKEVLYVDRMSYEGRFLGVGPLGQALIDINGDTRELLGGSLVIKEGS